MTSIETAQANYTRAVRDAHARHDGLVAQAENRHADASRRAAASYQLAIRAAEERLADETAKASAGLPKALSDAAETFDKACRRATGASNAAWLHIPGPNRIELRAGVGGGTLASVVDEGGGRWVLDTGTEIQFIADGSQARAALWRLAAQLPMPTNAA